MLRHADALEAPKRYPAPDPSPTAPLCAACTELWTPRLLAPTHATPASETPLAAAYALSTASLRAAVIRGCVWCRSLADGLHGRVVLDALNAEFARTDSWPSTPGEGEEDGGFVEVDDGDDDGGFSGLAGESRDVLALEAGLEVTLAFERGEDGLFGFLNVVIEAVGEEEVNEVQQLRGENAVRLRYHVNVDEFSVSGTSSTLPFPPKHIDTILGSQSNLTALKEWLQHSNSLLEDCDKESLRIPGRLIHIGDSRLRVIETSSHPFQESEEVCGFVALSYVWGTAQTFILLSSTKEKLMSSFDIEELPRTIQDAITVARYLGFTYIWVDALCIMQDAASDKATELPKMRQIYQSASLTLVAAVASSAAQGFLHWPTASSYLIPPIPIPMSQSQTTLLLSYPAGYQRQNDPVNDRAWTFQEWLLPRRIASFSYRGVEMLDRRIPPHPVANAEARLSDAPWRHGQLYTLSPDIEHRRTAWVSTRAEYSRRKLTVGSDKLLAIGAVAEELSRSYKGAYLAGLWEEELQAELQWSREWGGPGYQSGDMARPEGYIAPSWSWAAVVGAVEDHGVEAEKSSYNGGVDFSILDCSVQHAIPGFEFGAVVAGHLVVCGRIKSFIWRPEQDTPVKTCDGFLAICEVNDGDDQEWQVGEAMLDAEDDVLVDGCEVQCLAMAVVERVPDRPGTEGMVLVGIDGGRYRRVGYFRMFGMTQFDDVEVQEATIV